MKRYFSGVVVLIAAITMFSCDSDHFDMTRLASAKDLNPIVSAPLGYGTFKIDELNTGLLVATTPIPATGMRLDSVMLNKTGLSFRSSAIDSVFVVTHFTNNTSVDIEYAISFVDRTTGSQLGTGSSPEIVPAGAVDHKMVFKLDLAGQNSLQSASDIRLDFRLIGPATTTINYGAVRLKTIAVKISFYAPVSLWKLTN